MQKIKELIPNTLTSFNLLCGCIGIVFSFNGQLEYAASMIWVAGIFDFLDGFSARILKVSSEIGKQLDSLADMVTFGVLPGIILYQLIAETNTSEYLPYSAFIIVIFSAIRLAKFNIDTRQSDTFIGLPTPANAFCISAFPFMIESLDGVSGKLLSVILVIYVLLFSWLLIAEIKMLALKFKSMGWSGNEIRWLFIALSIPLLIGFQIIALPMVIILYILISILNNILTRASHV